MNNVDDEDVIPQDQEEKKYDPVWKVMIMIMSLYVIQGIPIGLAVTAMPILLKTKSSYTNVGIFSVAIYPYALKLLWAPIVDSVYWKRLGKRKTWIIPSQLLNGLVMIGISFVIDDLMDSRPIDIGLITAIFTIFVTLAATQDIAVDAWALELFEQKKRYLQATAQSFGIGMGIFISYSLFLALNSAEFCNKFLRSVPSEEGILSLSYYIGFWGVVYLVISILLFFKKELPYERREEDEISVIDAYKQIWRIIKLPNVLWLGLLLFFIDIGMIGPIGLFSLRLTASGFPQYLLAISTIIDLPITILSTVIVSQFTNKNPLKVLIISYSLSLIMVPICILIVNYYPTNNLEIGYIILIFVTIGFNSSGLIGMMLSKASFIAMIAHTKVGGSYITLFNTISSLSRIWPRLLSLKLLDLTTKSRCEPDYEYYSNTTIPESFNTTLLNSCSSSPESCFSNHGYCDFYEDGYWIVSTIFGVFGVLYIIPLVYKMLPLQDVKYEHWANPIIENENELINYVDENSADNSLLNLNDNQQVSLNSLDDSSSSEKLLK